MDFSVGGATSGDSMDIKPQLLNLANLGSSSAAVWPVQSSVDGSAAAGQDFTGSSNPNVAHNNTSPQSTSSNGNNAEMRSNDDGVDAEGVWSPDIDQAFHEALQIYPPCGRRKIILSDEGKMYGRNELIARYIKIRCGKTRTRKQVSSHIQVLARKKHRESQARVKAQQEGAVADISAAQHQQLMDQSTPPQMLSANASSISPNPHSADSQPSAALKPNSSNSGAAPFPPHPAAAAVAALAQQHKASPQQFLLGRDPLSASGPAIAAVQAQKMMLEAAASSGLSNGAQPMDWASYPLNAAHNLLVNGQLGGIHNQIAQNLVAVNNNITSASRMDYVPSAVENGPSVAMASCSSFATTPTDNFTIASSRLIMCGFSAYIELNPSAASENDVDHEDRVELVRIPKTSDLTMERIGLDCVQAKYPKILEELFRKGPADAFFLVKCWANMRFEISDPQSTLFAVDSFYESFDKFDIVVSTKVCSFGNEVVEKVEIYSPIDEEEEAKCSGVWHFRLEKSPMCDYMVRFISELKKLQEPSLMNSVLENFTVLQIVTEKQSAETLMVIAFIFEIREDGDDEIFTNIYRLT